MAMRWHTAVAVVTEGVEAHIEQRNQEASRGRELLYLLKSIGQPHPIQTNGRGGGDSEPIPVRQKGSRPAPGTVPDRVLSIVGESEEDSVTLQQILKAKHGAKDHHVKLAVRGLVKSGHLVATGATMSRRFSLPTRRKGQALNHG